MAVATRSRTTAPSAPKPSPRKPSFAKVLKPKTSLKKNSLKKSPKPALKPAKRPLSAGNRLFRGPVLFGSAATKSPTFLAPQTRTVGFAGALPTSPVVALRPTSDRSRARALERFQEVSRLQEKLINDPEPAIRQVYSELDRVKRCLMTIHLYGEAWRA